MLNDLERRIMRYMLRQNTLGSISIPFEDVILPYRVEAIRSLAQKGYVKNNSTLITASASLTAKGKYDFVEETKMMYGEYADKIIQLENYIDQGLEILKLKDTKEALRFIDDMLAIYRSQIDKSVVQSIRISAGMYNSDNITAFCDHELNQVILVLKSLLADIKIEANKQNNSSIQNINTFSPTITQTVNVEISLSNIISEITKSSLSQEEQNKLISLLADIEKSKSNKKTLWDKVKNTMKYLLDKGIEISAIVLPFLGQILSK